MREFLSFSRQFLKPLANSNICIFVNIAWKLNCDILKSKLICCEWNASYFIEIAFIRFMLHQIKKCASPTGTTNWVGASRFDTFSKQSSSFFCLLTETVLNTIQIIRYKLQDVKEQHTKRFNILTNIYDGTMTEQFTNDKLSPLDIL